MSGRCCLVSSFVWLVTKVFGYIISKARGLWDGFVCAVYMAGRGLFVVGCLLWCRCYVFGDIEVA